MTTDAGPDETVIEISVSTLKTNPTRYARKAEEGYRVYVTNGGERIMALVVPEAADALAEEEDAYWAKRIADAEDSGTVAWDQALVELEGGHE